VFVQRVPLNGKFAPMGKFVIMMATALFCYGVHDSKNAAKNA
jgi:hypothetical protein